MEGSRQRGATCGEEAAPVPCPRRSLGRTLKAKTILSYLRRVARVRLPQHRVAVPRHHLAGRQRVLDVLAHCLLVGVAAELRNKGCTWKKDSKHDLLHNERKLEFDGLCSAFLSGLRPSTGTVGPTGERLRVKPYAGGALENPPAPAATLPAAFPLFPVPPPPRAAHQAVLVLSRRWAQHPGSPSPNPHHRLRGSTGSG